MCSSWLFWTHVGLLSLFVALAAGVVVGVTSAGAPQVPARPLNTTSEPR